MIDVLEPLPQLRTLIVMDGPRRLARARYIRAERAWLLKANGFSWVDPRARKPNAFGIVDPRFMFIKTKREARKILTGLGS